MFLKLLADVPLNSAITLKFFSVENWKDKSWYILKLIVDVLSAWMVMLKSFSAGNFSSSEGSARVRSNGDAPLQDLASADPRRRSLSLRLVGFVRPRASRMH